MIHADIADAARRLPELLALAQEGEEVVLVSGDEEIGQVIARSSKSRLPESRLTRTQLDAIRNQVRLTPERMKELGIIPATNPNAALPRPVEGGRGSLLETLLAMRDEEYAELAQVTAGETLRERGSF